MYNVREESEDKVSSLLGYAVHMHKGGRQGGRQGGKPRREVKV